MLAPVLYREVEIGSILELTGTGSLPTGHSNLITGQTCPDQHQRGEKSHLFCLHVNGAFTCPNLSHLIEHRRNLMDRDTQAT